VEGSKHLLHGTSRLFLHQTIALYVQLDPQSVAVNHAELPNGGKYMEPEKVQTHVVNAILT
jgi:hypothetical protein